MERDCLDLASFEETPALKQCLRMRQRPDNGLAAAEQAVAHGVDDLAADPQSGAFPEQVVHLLHDAAKGVLHRQDRRIDLAVGDRVEGA